MPKFSIIITVYNVEKYLKKCLESIKNQSYKDYEVIIVNDGSTDKSKDILDEYDYKVINQKNQGLSVARNNGVKKAKGDYLIFLDSDDYIEKDLLKEINKSLKNNPDIVRFQIQDVKDNKVIKTYEEEGFNGYFGVRAFEKIAKYHYVENAWCYAIKRNYYLDEGFEFKKDTFHEDFGLIPLVIVKAKIVNSICYIGYNYVQRPNSIMSSNNYEKTKMKVEDFYNHYKYLIKEIDNTEIDSKVFKSFIANSLILKICELNDEDYKEYKNKLIEDKVYDNLLTDSITRKVKKTLYKISPKITSKMIK